MLRCVKRCLGDRLQSEDSTTKAVNAVWGVHFTLLNIFIASTVLARLQLPNKGYPWLYKVS